MKWVDKLLADRDADARIGIVVVAQAILRSGFRAWLTSDPGGSWHSTEIQVLNTPSIADVKKAIEKAGKIDYGFVTFSGHGYHSQELDKTKICLKDGRILALDLRPNADRCTLVIDACRKVMSETALMESYSLSASEIRKYAAFAKTRDFRREFETQMGTAEKGFIFLYSCDLNEAAGENASGGFFSRSLVEAGKGFADRSDGSRWYPMKNAFTDASSGTTYRNPAQHPRYEPGRRLVHFPFAV